MEQPKPNLTKERIYIEYPQFYGQEMVERHIRRYEWAGAHLMSENIVLDAACGSGYGSLLLKQKCKAVVGIDLSKEAIDYAQANAKNAGIERVHFLNGDLSHIESHDLKYNPFNAVVCIETIEHLDTEMQNAFMHGVTKRLACEGKLFITTPIKRDIPMTEYHLKEFTSSEFKDFLAQYFDRVILDVPQLFGISPNFILARCSRPKIS
ncbi:MAG: hypothetical protein A3H42_04570 [Deltaproteobacteria bacterium RIFCSPLOWO2_02_FULL_46_8]|nr:MAG: hypothetical protein A3H42_04570 [Deltaproteobacteria bacterium RIFCSPLOWO2_02_FULL_46_8]